jgi:hypothetical protein
LTLDMNATPKKSCSSCGASLNATAQFCHSCGAKQGAESKPVPPALLGLVAFAVIAVVAVIAYSVGKSSTPQAVPGGPSAPVTAGPGAPPDISNMTPRQQADALFNRVMTAHENGDFASVNQFAPMAVNAYSMLGELDPDAHYHIGLMSAITGNLDEARARAESIQAQVPVHLLASLLRNSAAQMAGDEAAILAAKRTFLENYDAEIVTGRQEYIDHQRSIESFKAQAEAAVGGGS